VMQEGDRSIEFHLGPCRAADGKVNRAQRVAGVLPGLTSCYAHAAQPRENHQADCEAHDVARIRAIHGLVWMSARESSACHVRLCRSLRRLIVDPRAFGVRPTLCFSRTRSVSAASGCWGALYV